VAWAYARGKGGVESVKTIANDPGVEKTVKTLVAGLDGVRAAHAAMVDALFKEQAAALGVKAVVPAPNPRAQELSLMIPRKKFKTFSEDARKLTERAGAGGGRGAGGRGGAAAAGPPTGRGAGGLPGLAASEVSGFIDGTRSILDIYNAVRAEYGHVNTNSNAFKFAYVLSPDYPDIDMEAVATAIANMVTAGSVEIRTLEPKPVKATKK
jgi:hypothetical protein